MNATVLWPSLSLTTFGVTPALRRGLGLLGLALGTRYAVLLLT